MSKYFRDVLCCKLMIFFNILHLNSFFKHLLILSIHGIFGQFDEFLLLFFDLLYFLEVVFMHQSCQSLNISFLNGRANFWLAC